MTYTAIVFGIDFNNIMFQKIGVFELDDTSVIKDPEDTYALLDWVSTNEFDIKGYPYIQVHIQRWSGTTLVAQYQHFFRVIQVKITKSFKFETEIEYIPFDELPPI